MQLRKNKDFIMGVKALSPWKQARLFINSKEVQWGAPIGLLRGQANTVRVQVPPVLGKALSLGLVNDDGLTVGAEPAFNEWVSGIDEQFTWTIAPDAGKSGRIQLVVFSREVDEFWDLACWVISSDLAQEVDKIMVDGVASPPANILFFRNEPKTVTVTYAPGSPLPGYPLELKATPLSGLQDNDLAVTLITEKPHTWAVNASNNSGTFKLELNAAGGTTGIMLPASKVISRNLNDEVKILLDGDEIPANGADFIGGGTKTLTFDYLNADVLKNIPLAVDAVLETGLLPGDVTGIPSLRELTTKHEWKVTGADKNGVFRLKLYSEQEMAVLHTPNIRIKQKLADVNFIFVELVGDAPLPVPPEEYLYPDNYLSKTCALILRNSEGSPLRDVPVTVSQPDMDDWVRTTDHRGKIPYFIANINYVAGDTFKVVAVASLPDGSRSTELWVRVVKAGQL
jgi:hypothetical protein